MAAKEWYQVRPGPSVMVEFSNNDAKILTSNSVFEELPTNKCIIRLLRGKRPRLRKMVVNAKNSLDMALNLSALGNVIDLSDPGIISYEKKDLKDGKEKITIVRKKPTEKDMEMHKMIMHGGSAHPMMIHSGHPGKAKTIKVTSSDDGNIEIIEDGKVRRVKMDGENVKIIEEDGRTIRIEEINDDNEKTIRVKVVEEEIEK